jgi:hypothetical protein
MYHIFPASLTINAVRRKSQKKMQRDAKRAAIELGKPKSPSMTSQSS